MTDTASYCVHWVHTPDKTGVCTASLCRWQDRRGDCTVHGLLNARPSNPKDYTTKTDPNRRPL